MIQFAHSNIITDDWERLADFYIKVFGCKPLYPERDLSGTWLDKVTNIKNAHIRGIHLVMPGYEDNAPTLAIFQYNNNVQSPTSQPNRKGFGHIAFKVDDVHKTLYLLLENGGTQVGEVVETKIQDSGTITLVYARDIDGNIVELQNWRS